MRLENGEHRCSQDASSAQIRWETTACCHLFRRSDICLVAKCNARLIARGVMHLSCCVSHNMASFPSKSLPVSWNKHKGHANTPSEIFTDRFSHLEREWLSSACE